MEKIFEVRARDIRKGCIALMLSNFFFQVKALADLDTPNEIAIQAIYWVLVLAACILLSLSYKNGRLYLVKYAFIIMVIRNILRLFNFEESIASDNVTNLQ